MPWGLFCQFKLNECKINRKQCVEKSWPSLNEQKNVCTILHEFGQFFKECYHCPVEFDVCIIAQEQPRAGVPLVRQLNI